MALNRYACETCTLRSIPNSASSSQMSEQELAGDATGWSEVDQRILACAWKKVPRAPERFSTKV